MRVAPLALIGALLLSMLPLAESPAAAPASLFDTPPTVRAPSSGVASRAIVRQRPVTSRLGLLVRPDGSPALGVGGRIQLNLFADAGFSMAVTNVTRHPGYGLTWSGTLDGVDLGSAALAVYEGVLVGHVATPSAVYRVGHTPDGSQVVEEIDTAALPSEAPPIVPASSEDEAITLGGATGDAAGDTGAQIDVAVLYTAAARAAAGGTAAIRATAALAVDTANRAYANNNLAQRLRLVFSGELPLKEGNFSNDLIALLATLRADPVMGWLRNVTRADLVALLVDYGSGASICGRGHVLTTNSASSVQNAFSVIERSCAVSNLSFPHELGHNMGGHHDAFVIGTDPTVFPYSHGWVDLVGKFRTIMAYNDQCAAQIPSFNCPRLPFFSTPDQTPVGRPLGNAATADNVRTLAATASTVASFRQSLTSPLTITGAVNQPTYTTGQTLVVSVSVNHSGGLTGTADFYAGIQLSDGTAVFFTDVTTTQTGGYALGTIANLASYRPIATGIPLGAPFAADLPTFFSYQRGAGDPSGGFAFFGGEVGRPHEHHLHLRPVDRCLARALHLPGHQSG